MAGSFDGRTPTRGVEQAIVALKKGAYLLKCGKRGKPKFCSFRLSSDETALIWYSKGREKRLSLSSVSAVVLGQKTNFADKISATALPREGVPVLITYLQKWRAIT